MDILNESLVHYVTEQILPLYNNVDEGHNLTNHILPVIKDSLNLMTTLKTELNANIVYVVAAYHDLGLLKGRENHHLYSKRFVLRDQELRKYFTSEEINLIAEAVEDHRSTNTNKPRSIYGMIIADCDRNVNLDEIIFRTHLSIKSKYPNLDLSDFETEFAKAYEWIVAKNSKTGQLSFFLDKRKQKALTILQEQVLDKELIKRKYQKIYWKWLLCENV